MAAFRRFLMFILFVGSMLFIFMSSYRSSTSQAKTAESIHQRQEQRKQQLKERCLADKKTFPEMNHSFEDMSRWEFQNLIVDDKHGIIYCYIPKVACSNWKRVLFVLNQSDPYPDPLSIDREFVHKPNLFPLLSRFPKSQIKMKLKHYTKFLFVRDPFVRLVSAYRDKFLHNKDNEYFYQYYAKLILRLYGNQLNPPKTLRKAFASGVHPSFYNFIQYLLDPTTEWKDPFEPHWRQMYRLCHPCHIQYDFVGHQETLQDDAEELLKILKLHNDIKFPPSYENITSPESVMSWFKTVPLEDRRKLYKIYERDFRLFGYRRPDELLDG